jgi:malate dehydrogenase (oxaloacetate-decarboxylating)
VVETLEQQVHRRYQAYQEQPTDVARHVNLRALQDTNEMLFYRLVSDHIEEMLPILYTPTVGLACQRFSEIYRRPRGLFIAYPDRDRIGEILRNRPRRKSTSSWSPTGNGFSAWVTRASAAWASRSASCRCTRRWAASTRRAPCRCSWTSGTDNAELLDDPHVPRLAPPPYRRRRYDDFVDRFVQAVRAELPGVLLQWEDFATPHALPILERYRDQLLSFNDDIQGTAAVVLAALSAGAAATGSRLRDQTVVMLGAGSAGIGSASRSCGRWWPTACPSGPPAPGSSWPTSTACSPRTARTSTRRSAASPSRRRRARHGTGRPADLTDVIDAVHPTALIGLSTASGAFTEEVVRRIAAHVKRPVIMPLSNPTSRSEARPQDLADWTEGRALVATGSPFPPMRVGEPASRSPSATTSTSSPGSAWP